MKKRNIFGSLGAGAGALLLAFSNLGSYAMGLIRDIVMAGTFGATSESDLFYAAIGFPDFLTNVLALGFISGGLLPIFSALNAKSKKEAEDFFSSFLTILIFGITFGAFLFYIFAPFLVAFFFGTQIIDGGEVPRDPETLHRISSLMRLLLLSPILFGLSNSVGMILLAKKRFLLIALSPVLNNVGMIAGIFFLAPAYGIASMAYGAIFGALLHLSVRIFDLFFTGFSFSFRISFSPSVKKVFWIGVPKVFAFGFFQATLLAFSFLVAKNSDGGLLAWNFARNIQSMPVSLFGISVATAALPFLSDAINTNAHKDFLRRLHKNTVQILFFSFPSAIGIALLSPLIVEVLFQRGQFDAEATFLTASILTLLALAIPLEGMMHLMARAFLARQKTLFPAFGKLLFFLIAVSTAHFFYSSLGASALGVGFSFGLFSELIFLFLGFHFFCQNLSFTNLFRPLFKIVLSGLAMGISVFFLLFFGGDILPPLFLLALSIGLGGIVFLVFTFFLGIEELRVSWIFQFFRKRS